MRSTSTDIGNPGLQAGGSASTEFRAGDSGEQKTQIFIPSRYLNLIIRNSEFCIGISNFKLLLQKINKILKLTAMVPQLLPLLLPLLLLTLLLPSCKKEDQPLPPVIQASVSRQQAIPLRLSLST